MFGILRIAGFIEMFGHHLDVDVCQAMELVNPFRGSDGTMMALVVEISVVRKVEIKPVFHSPCMKHAHGIERDSRISQCRSIVLEVIRPERLPIVLIMWVHRYVVSRVVNCVMFVLVHEDFVVHELLKCPFWHSWPIWFWVM